MNVRYSAILLLLVLGATLFGFSAARPAVGSGPEAAPAPAGIQADGT